MRIKLFEAFNKETAATEALAAIAKAAQKDKSVKWIEPVLKGKLDFDEDQSSDKSLIFEVDGKTVSIDFSWSHDVNHGTPADRDYPGEPGSDRLTDIQIDAVELSDDGASEDASFTSGPVEDAAWLLLYDLLPGEPDRQMGAKAKKLRNK